MICYDLRYQPLAVGDFLDYVEVGLILGDDRVVISYDPAKPVISDPGLRHINRDNLNHYLGQLATIAGGVFPHPVKCEYPLPINQYNYYTICAMVEKSGPVPIVFDEIWAREFLAFNEVRYSVQLRYSEHNRRRNSDMPQWLAFLRARPERFVLLGDVPDEFRLNNTIVAKDSYTTLRQDLALIAACDVHIGVSSGPAQVAVYGGKPYCLFEQTVKPERCPQFHIQNHDGKWSWAKSGQFFAMFPQADKYIHMGFDRCLQSV